MPGPPNKPSEFKALIPSPTGSFCHKFVKLFALPRMVSDFITWMWNEEGEQLSEEYKDIVCGIPCFESNTGTGDEGDSETFGAPQNVTASDGEFSDRVVVTWDTVKNAASYQVYRSVTNSVASSELVATVSVLTYADLTAEEGQQYHYWVKAVDNNSTQSAYSTPDSGYASGVLTAVSDLTASRGLDGSGSPGHAVVLNWTPVDGADHYDIYRGTTNDFSEADLIDLERVPFKTYTSHLRRCSVEPCDKNIFAETLNNLYYQDKLVANSPTDPVAIQKYYYWVVAKKMDGAQTVATSSESNSADGWSSGFGDGTTGFAVTEDLENLNPALDVGVSGRWRFTLLCSGGYGAGGNAVYGGGGGGGGVTVEGVAMLTAGGKVRLVETPAPSTSQTNSETNGADGPVVTLEYSADGTFTDTIELVTSTQPGGGVWNAGGGGSGGAGGSASVHASVSDERILDGNAGQAASAGVGGVGGNGHFNYDVAPSNYNVGPPAWTGDGPLSCGGGGSYARPFSQFGGRSTKSRAHFFFDL